MPNAFLVEVLFVCDSCIVASREWMNTAATEQLAAAVWQEIVEHRAESRCECGDAAAHTVEINASNTATGDAMGIADPRSEAEVDSFFKDDWFVSV